MLAMSCCVLCGEYYVVDETTFYTHAPDDISTRIMDLADHGCSGIAISINGCCQKCINGEQQPVSPTGKFGKTNPLVRQGALFAVRPLSLTNSTKFATIQPSNN